MRYLPRLLRRWHARTGHHTAGSSRSSAAQRLARRRTLWVIVSWLFVVFAYWFFVTAGHFNVWPVYTSAYDLMAEGFRAGQLNIKLNPSPELLAQRNPYHFDVGQWWAWDYSLYHGKYYAYWGPLPGLVQAAAKATFKINRPIGDQYLTFAFSAAYALTGMLLINLIAPKLFGRVPTALVCLAGMVFAFANPAPYLVSTAGVAQAAIVGGQSFLLAGLGLAIMTVWDHRRRHRTLRLTLAGVLWGLALTCRFSLAPAIGVIALSTILASCADPLRRARDLVTSAFSIGLPLSAIVLALFCYNKARFDEWLEFGTSLQVTTMKFCFLWRHFIPNLYTYMLRPSDPSCSFPFLHVRWPPGPTAMPSFIHPSPGYSISEPVYGWVRALPCAWLIPLALLKTIRGIAFDQASRVGPFQPSARQQRTRILLVVSLVTIACLGGMAVMGLFIATMRYMADMTSGLVLLGVLGGLDLWRWRPNGWRSICARTVVVAAFVGTIGIGLLLGYQGYVQHFQSNNPTLHQRLRSALSFCPDRFTH